MNTEGKETPPRSGQSCSITGLSLNNTVVRTNFHSFAIDSTLMRLYLDNLFGADFNMKLQRYFELFFHINNSFGFL